LKRRLLFLLGALIVYRIGAHIPVPGIDPVALAEFFNRNQGGFFGMINMFSGGALSRFTIFALGIMPYISSSIIMQLMTHASPQLEALRKEGEAGRRKITQYTRYGTVVLSVFQGIGIAIGVESQGLVPEPGILFRFVTVTTLLTGTMFLMWLGEQITERGLGNGISIIIFAGIVAGLPNGRIAVAYNKGTKEAPKFAKPVDIKSTETIAPVDAPNVWIVDYGLNRGNFYCVPEVLTAAEDESGGVGAGKSYLRLSYKPLSNLVMPQITEGMYPRATDPDFSASEMFTYWARSTLGNPARTFRIDQQRINPMYGKRYVLTFKYKGNFTDGAAGISRGDVRVRAFVAANRRGGGTQRDVVDDVNFRIPITASTTWREVKREFMVVSSLKEIKDQAADPKQGPASVLTGFTFTAVGSFPNNDSDFYITDVSITPVN